MSNFYTCFRIQCSESVIFMPDPLLIARTTRNSIPLPLFQILLPNSRILPQKTAISQLTIYGRSPPPLPFHSPATRPLSNEKVNKHGIIYPLLSLSLSSSNWAFNRSLAQACSCRFNLEWEKSSENKKLGLGGGEQVFKQ